MNGYKDADRLWRAMLEWLEQFEALVTRLASDGVDVVDIVKVQVGVSENPAPNVDPKSLDKETPRLRWRRLKHGSEPPNRAKASSVRTDMGTGAAAIGGKLLCIMMHLKAWGLRPSMSKIAA